MADAAEVQILKGPDLSVTTTRVVGPEGELAVAGLAAPDMQPALIRVSVTRLVAMIGLGLFAAGLLVRVLPLWITGLAIATFSPLARVQSPGYIVTAAVGDQRRTVYSTRNEGDAKLAVAALIEAIQRAAQDKPVEGS